MTPAAIYANVASVAKNHPHVDAVYIQSGTMAALPIIENLEQAIAKPVISSNSASIFSSFKALGVKANRGYGKLLVQPLMLLGSARFRLPSPVAFDQAVMDFPQQSI